MFSVVEVKLASEVVYRFLCSVIQNGERDFSIDEEECVHVHSVIWRSQYSETMEDSNE